MKSKSSNKSFGIVFSVVFLLVALWPILNENEIRFWALILSVIFLALGLLNSKILTPLKILWLKLGEKLGIIVSPIVMGIIYFFVITPTGLLVKLFGKDLLNIKFSKEKTYWIKRDKLTGSMRRQF
ncbi:SxtJ family membrane protein [Pelagibacteraceae bacterium]|jgi:hypothetical protein|nr:SxtJ family membrane protein [Pelagibacteraceae bacterium]MDB9743437.1 SxtJ family membrane protein [Pelagibacteraceae bacterium]MDC0340271.1 SxtJ family membrane protein [Pelagibacteraceae bacterium]MDC0365889.1 SxtJ family membrane protein [Pelagibacteraceae bacterium]|tara:strand:- start:2416 stop:2793 length:378 start_codon:yes stop_codon:yes gene_type:complete